MTTAGPMHGPIPFRLHVSVCLIEPIKLSQGVIQTVLIFLLGTITMSLMVMQIFHKWLFALVFLISNHLHGH